MTKVGSFSTSKTCKVTFALPQFHKHREITWKMHVENTDSKKNTYDMIIGRDLMHEMGLNIDFQKGRMVWDNAWVNMQNPDHFRENLLEEFEEELFLMHDPDTTEAERIQRIVDVKYSPANLEEEVKKADLLNKQEQQELLKLLKKFEPLFDGTLGDWKTKPVDLKLKDPGSKPVYQKPYPVPKSKEQKLKQECNRLVGLGILKKVNHSEWGMPAFTISKADGSLRSLADSRKLNQLIKRMPYPLPKIQDMLPKLEGFQWATSLDLNMGYYHIRLMSNASNLCTVVFSWGNMST